MVSFKSFRKTTVLLNVNFHTIRSPQSEVHSTILKLKSVNCRLLAKKRKNFLFFVNFEHVFSGPLAKNYENFFFNFFVVTPLAIDLAWFFAGGVFSLKNLVKDAHGLSLVASKFD